MSVLQTPFSPEQKGESPSNADALNKLQTKNDELEQTNKDLLKVNTHMSEQMATSQKKIEELEKQLSNNKKLKWMIHYAAGIQCIQCQQIYAREEFEQHLPECRNTVKRLSTMHAVTISTPIKIKILAVRNGAEADQLAQAGELSLDKIVYTINVVNKQTQKDIEVSLQEIATFIEAMCQSFPNQLDEELAHTITNDGKKVAQEYGDKLFNQIEDFFAKISRIPAMRAREEFKAFFDLDKSEQVSQENSLERDPF